MRRATVYRYFPGKQPLLAAVVDREIDRMQHLLLDAADGVESLADAATAVVVTGARALQRHAALAFLAAYEPEQLLPFLAFERENAVLRAAAALVAPAFEPFLAPPDCERLGEWLARITLSYLCSPSEQVDITDPSDVRALVEDFVLPGFVRPVMIRGGSQ